MGLWPVLGDQVVCVVVCVVVGLVVGPVVGVVGDQLVGVEGDEAEPGYCGQGLLHASHSLPLRLLSGPILVLPSEMLHCLTLVNRCPPQPLSLLSPECPEGGVLALLIAQGRP